MFFLLKWNDFPVLAYAVLDPKKTVKTCCGTSEARLFPNQLAGTDTRNNKI